MKNILAILCSVALMLTSCDSNKSGGETVAPNFPEVQNLVVESGKSYDIIFTAERAWTVSLPDESQVYATLTYDGVTDMQFFGEAGEHTITVNIREEVISYAKDYIINVEITLSNITQNLAVLTLPKVPYEILVTGSAPVGKETDVQSTFEEGGHPENGPFVSVANTYTVRYLNRSDAMYGDFVVSHDCDLLFNYVLYAKSSPDGEFEAVADNSNNWLNLRKWKPADMYNFSLDMLHNNAKAVKTEGVGYEAYVNLEDENGDALVSVYFIYDPTAVVEVKTSIGLANPTLAAEKGVTFEGAGMSYTLTLPSATLIGDDYAAATLKLEGYSSFFGGIESGSTSFDVNTDTTTGLCYLTLKESVKPEALNRTEVLKISGTAISGGLHEYTINLVFDWVSDESDNEEVTR